MRRPYVAGAVVGAAIGGAVGYLCFTESGRRRLVAFNGLLDRVFAHIDGMTSAQPRRAAELRQAIDVAVAEGMPPARAEF